MFKNKGQGGSTFRFLEIPYVGRTIYKKDISSKGCISQHKTIFHNAKWHVRTHSPKWNVCLEKPQISINHLPPGWSMSFTRNLMRTNRGCWEVPLHNYLHNKRLCAGLMSSLTFPYFQIITKNWPWLQCSNWINLIRQPTESILQITIFLLSTLFPERSPNFPSISQLSKPPQ